MYIILTYIHYGLFKVFRIYIFYFFIFIVLRSFEYFGLCFIPILFDLFARLFDFIILLFLVGALL